MKRKWKKFILYAVQETLRMFLIAVGAILITMGLTYNFNIIVSIIMVAVGIHTIREI